MFCQPFLLIYSSQSLPATSESGSNVCKCLFPPKQRQEMMHNKKVGVMITSRSVRMCVCEHTHTHAREL